MKSVFISPFRFYLVFFIVFMAFSSLGGRLFYLQVVKADEFAEIAQGARNNFITLIWSCYNYSICTNIISVRLYKLHLVRPFSWIISYNSFFFCDLFSYVFVIISCRNYKNNILVCGIECTSKIQYNEISKMTKSQVTKWQLWKRMKNFRPKF